MTEDNPNPNGSPPITDAEIYNGSEGEAQDGDLQSYAAQIIRPARGGLEDLLAVELAIATYAADPILKIRHVLESFKLLTEEQQKKIVPEPSDLEEYDRIYDLCLSFAQMPEIPKGAYEQKVRYASIPFAFASSDAIKYLGFLFDKTIIIAAEDNSWAETVKKLRSEPRDSPTWGKYASAICSMFVSGEMTTVPMCLRVKAIFCSWAMPKVIRLLKAIFETYVSPQAWQGATNSFRKQGGKA